MDRSNGDPEPGSRGFAYTRREVLETGGAVGAGTALAGCGWLNDDDDGDGTTPEQGSAYVGDGELVDDGLAVLGSSFVDDPRRVDLQDELDDDIQTARYVRVRIRNELDDDIGTVTLSVDLFDDRDQFLEVQMASVSELRSSEVFEGFIPFRNPEASLYLVRARRSRRVSVSRPMDSVRASDHCLVDDEVRGTVTNDGDEQVERLDVRVRYLDDDGNVVGTAFNTLSGLAVGESRDFDVALGDSLDGTGDDVADYTVDVGDHSVGSTAVR